MISGRNRLTRGLADLLATQRGYQTYVLNRVNGGRKPKMALPCHGNDSSAATRLRGTLAVEWASLDASGLLAE
jgi:hypothetical protein